MRVTHLNATNPTLKGHMVGVTRDEARRLIASLDAQLEGSPLCEEFSDGDGEYFAIGLMGEAELDNKTETLHQALIDGETSDAAGDLDFSEIRGKANTQHSPRLTKDELAAVATPIDQQLPDEEPCIECSGEVNTFGDDMCADCARRKRLDTEQAEQTKLDRFNEQCVESRENALAGAAAFFRSAALTGEDVGPDHCDGCRRAYAALSRGSDSPIRGGADNGGNGYCFALVDDPGDDCHGWFLVATREFWDENKHLDDYHLSGSVRMPDGFDEVMESVFEFDGDGDKGRAALLAAGFDENLDMLP